MMKRDRSRLQTLYATALFVLAGPALAASQGPPVQPTSTATSPANSSVTAPADGPATAPVRVAQSEDDLLEEARSALRTQDFATALRVLTPLAQSGQPEAQCLLGMLHQNGYGTAQDDTEAVRWYTRSALQGWVDGLFMLGQMYYNGRGVTGSFERAADLFLLTAITGDADGQWAFGVCVSSGEGRPRDLIEGGAWLLLASSAGQKDAQAELTKLREQLEQDDVPLVEGLAGELAEMIANDGFDPAKMPVVPVPPFMADEAQPITPPRLKPTSGPTQAEPQLLRADMNIDAEMLATGDMRGRVSIAFPAEVYGQMRELVPDPRLWMRDLISGRSDQEIGPDTRSSYDDTNSAVVIDLQMLGAVHNTGGGRWEWEAENQTLVGIEPDASGRLVAAFEMSMEMPEEGLAFAGTARYRLPDGATSATFDSASSLLRYRLPYAGPHGQGRLRADFDVRDRIMSALYKVYGMETDFAAQWVAKAVLTNVGDGPLTDVRVRFQLGNYSELDLWQKFPEVVPGQTIVAVYHPVLASSIAQLTSTTPTNLLCEWRSVDAQGQRHEDSDGGRINILGRHEFVFSNLTPSESTGSYFDAFSNADLVAAWVSRDDPVVKQFAAAANKAAGGAGAPYSDEAAWLVLKACYELWLANDFTYQGPTGLTDASMSFDNNIVQNIKFPRDVIRDRSGTCIELACLYCAMGHAVGLKSYMVLIPGHAFPAFQLPSGRYLPVEATGIGGGRRRGSAPFEEIVEVAEQTYAKAEQDGRVIIVDIEDAWTRGVSSPELEAVPADILQRWQVVLDFTLSQGQPVVQGPPRPEGPVQPTTGPVQPHQPPRETPRQTSGTSFVGKWSGQVDQPLPNGTVFTWPMVIEIREPRSGQFEADFYGEAEIKNEWGAVTRIEVLETFRGKLESGKLAMTGRSKTVKYDGVPQNAPTDTMTMSIVGGQLQGTTFLAEGGTVTFKGDREQ